MTHCAFAKQKMVEAQSKWLVISMLRSKVA
jgi:hypothetical protein